MRSGHQLTRLVSELDTTRVDLGLIGESLVATSSCPAFPGCDQVVSGHDADTTRVATNFLGNDQVVSGHDPDTTRVPR